MKRTLIPVGPFHPIMEEPEFFQLYVEGETIVDVDVRLSYNHRGIEKRCEELTYDQIPFILARICGICSGSHPCAFCQAVEDVAGIEVPRRGRLLRTIILELERIHSHLLWAGLAGHFIGYNTVFMWAWRYREPVLDLCERITGNRNHYDNFCVGGCRRDIPDEAIPDIRRTVKDIVGPLEMLIGAVLDDPVLSARLKGIGVLKKEDAVRWCVTGPTARGSGVEQDIRRTEPYASYDEVPWNVVVRPEGDVFAKVVVRLLETAESVKIILNCLDQMEPGPIRTDVLEIPEGEGIGHVEAPRGETFHYVLSDGTEKPVRYKVRAPTYVNLPSFKSSVVGAELADAMLIVAAMDPCYSCTERVAVMYRRRGETQTLSAQELLEKSWQKTERIRKAI